MLRLNLLDAFSQLKDNREKQVLLYTLRDIEEKTIAVKIGTTEINIYIIKSEQ